MKIKLRYFVIFISLLVFNCKNESNKQGVNSNIELEEIEHLSEVEKTKIVSYYLINGRQLREKDFHEIIFLNDISDSVKVIHYEGKDAFFSFKFSKALNFYNANKK
ncbi:hypothetical protein BZARG_2527 [Bizionia argentinensis JUB59]|uniref:Uncharacterized protein n=1 Tax=Bizionia argentinensis JUB59 TaxID=1046627 RepID=G2EFP5_9FLAO|nr:hypothetical protein [Bizionia argentinensis]EGV42750.1 hypothetical protein BZARG_2527 [Bizionia argentinensis JUB59]